MQAIRSDSLWRSSAAPAISVVPRATQATAASSGSSSMASATCAAPRRTPVSGAWRTRTSPMGSPLVAAGAMSTRAPMRSSARKKPNRVGLSETPRTVTSPPGIIAAAAQKKAAADGSPGTTTWVPTSACGPGRVRRPSGWRCRVAPKAGSIRSVWSRLAVAPPTVQAPLAPRAASKKALLICADASPSTTSAACNAGARPAVARSTSGARPSGPHVTCAPRGRSTSATRAIGRRISEASPTRRAPPPRPAKAPANSRRVVPLLPQSRVGPST